MLAYEKSISPRQSFVLKGGIIGLGVNVRNNARGGYVSAAYKFYLSNDYRMRGQRATHVLHGRFFMPELVLGGFSNNSESIILSNDGTLASLLLNYGRQWVIDDSFVTEYYIGAGFHLAENDTIAAFNYFSGGRLAFKVGLNIGFAF